MAEHPDVVRAELERNRRFISSVSHDLKSPACAIAGFAELLQREMGRKGAPERWSQIAWRIAHSSRGLIAMIDDILTLSRLEMGNEVICPDWTDQLPWELKETLLTFESEADSRQVGLALVMAPPIPAVRWDLRRLRYHAVNNLLSNALKFTPEGGKVTVRVRVEEECLMIDVADTGPGIPEEERERIFTPFEQGALSRGHGGAGLGLANARLMARLHGGELTVRPNPDADSGALFTLSLPVGGPASLQMEIPHPGLRDS